jgi:hypothetical protein
MREVRSDHSFTGETLLKRFPHATAVNKAEILNGLYSFNLVFDDEAGDTVLDDLGYRTARVSDDGRSAGHGFDHHKAEWLRPIDGK